MPNFFIFFLLAIFILYRFVYVTKFLRDKLIIAPLIFLIGSILTLFFVMVNSSSVLHKDSYPAGSLFISDSNSFVLTQELKNDTLFFSFYILNEETQEVKKIEIPTQKLQIVPSLNGKSIYEEVYEKSNWLRGFNFMNYKSKFHINRLQIPKNYLIKSKIINN